MSFHFKRLHIKDWLVYGGETELEFPQFEEGKNLIVFNGQNGYGKTSLLRALRFVFYNRANKSELMDLWNEHARHTGAGTLEVGIEFTQAERVCKIIRGVDFKPRSTSIVVNPWIRLFINNNEEKDQVEDKIEQLLPRDCLEFVFFDGAEISRYARKQHDVGVRDAIEKVLGIPAVRNLHYDLNVLIASLEDEQERLLSQTRQAEELLAEIEALKDEEESYLGRRRTLLEQKQSLETTRKELQAEADGIEAIERERRELQEKQRRRAELNERKAELDAEIQQIVTRVPLSLLEEAIRQIVEEYRAKQQPSPRREVHIAQLRVLRELLEQDECLCGREISDVVHQKFTDELTRLEKLFSGVSSQSAADTNDFLELSALLKSIHERHRKPEDLIDKRASVLTHIEELETDIIRLRHVLEGHELVSVNELFQQISQLSQQVAESDSKIRSIDENLARTRGDLLQKQRQLDAIGATNEQARGVTRTLEETRRIYKAVSELVDKLVQQKRIDIETISTEVFQQITNKPDEYEKLRVKDDYTLEVVRKDGSVVENEKLSAGEKEVVAYSFITALNLSSVDPAPFVMDTPFGHLDSGHRARLLQSLPKLHVQAILLATDRDLPPNERDAIDSSIIKEFTLQRDQQHAITTIREC